MNPFPFVLQSLPVGRLSCRVFVPLFGFIYWEKGRSIISFQFSEINLSFLHLQKTKTFFVFSFLFFSCFSCFFTNQMIFQFQIGRGGEAKKGGWPSAMFLSLTQNWSERLICLLESHHLHTLAERKPVGHMTTFGYLSLDGGEAAPLKAPRRPASCF